VVTHQLQVERRTVKAHRPKTNALPLDHATNPQLDQWRWTRIMKSLGGGLVASDDDQFNAVARLSLDPASCCVVWERRAHLSTLRHTPVTCVLSTTKPSCTRPRRRQPVAGRRRRWSTSRWWVQHVEADVLAAHRAATVPRRVDDVMWTAALTTSPTPRRNDRLPLLRATFHAHVTASDMEVSLPPVLVFGMPCHHNLSAAGVQDLNYRHFKQALKRQFLPRDAATLARSWES